MGNFMNKGEYTFAETLKSEMILAILIFIPLMFTITGIL